MCFGIYGGDPAFNGDKFAGPDDLEVDIATNVGILNPGASATVVFATVAAAGGTSATALTGLQSAVSEANACYNQIAGIHSLQAEPVPVMSKWGVTLFVLITALSAGFVLTRKRNQA